MDALSPNLRILLDALATAGKFLLRDFGELEQLQSSMGGTEKFAAAARERTARALLDSLLEARPRFGYSFGVDASLPEVRGQDISHKFLLGVMDGFENFSRAMPFFALSAAIEEQGKVIACVVYNPILDKLFFAEKNGGAFVLEARMTRRIRVSRRRESPLSRDFGCPALAVCYVAAGMLDKYAGTDTPASLIVREAGGKADEKEGLLICSNGNF